MTVKVTTILKCDNCSNVASKQVARVAMVNWARMVAMEKGWTTSIKNGRKIDLCPNCKVAPIVAEAEEAARR